MLTPLMRLLFAGCCALLLLRPAAAITCASGDIVWKDLCWHPRSSTGGPCGSSCTNRFNPSFVSVDASGNLVLKIAKSSNKWYCSEVWLSESLGYGTYTWQVLTDPTTIHQNLVASPFIYSTDTQEFDVEFSRWGVASNTYNAQHCVQPPPYNSTNLDKFLMPSTGTTAHRHTITWSSSGNKVDFSSVYTNALTLATATRTFNYTGPSGSWPPGTERVHMNFWMFQGKPPSATSTFVVKCFSFCPEGGGACRGDLAC